MSEKEERGLVKYQDRSGNEVKLNPDMVRKYLVTGKRDLVTDQEVMYFIGTCMARGLNPFARDCYLIKYTDEPAAIITSIDFFRARARAQADCKGWACGVIVQKDGELRYSKGLVLEGEKVVGGWFRATPQGWQEPFELEVNLSGYVKKTREGKATRFWSEENWPTMITKVAESQGLRRIWPAEFQGLHIQEESRLDIIDVESVKMVPVVPAQRELVGADFEESNLFDRLVQQRLIDSPDTGPYELQSVMEFVKITSAALNISEKDLKAKAEQDFDKFCAAFEKWRDKNRKPEEPVKGKGRSGRKPKQTQEPLPSPSPEIIAQPEPSDETTPTEDDINRRTRPGN